jgi:hypothetical protein
MVGRIKAIAMAMREVGAVRARCGDFELELGPAPETLRELRILSPDEERTIRLQEARQRMEIMYAASGAGFSDADVEAFAGI